MLIKKFLKIKKIPFRGNHALAPQPTGGGRYRLLYDVTT